MRFLICFGLFLALATALPIVDGTQLNRFLLDVGDCVCPPVQLLAVELTATQGLKAATWTFVFNKATDDHIGDPILVNGFPPHFPIAASTTDSPAPVPPKVLRPDTALSVGGTACLTTSRMVAGSTGTLFPTGRAD
jgi:hypothetical protein